MFRVVSQAAAAARAGSEPDMSLLSELFEEIERKPPGIEARKILINHYMAINWMEAACESVTELSRLAPRDSEVKSLVAALRNVSSFTQPSPTSPSPPRYTTSSPTQQKTFFRFPIQPTPVVLPKDRHMGKIELLHGYESLLERARSLLTETTLLRDFTQQTESQQTGGAIGILNVLGSFFAANKKKENEITSRFEKHIPDLVAITDGRVSSVVRVKQPGSVKSVSKAMQSKPKEALDIAFNDLEDMARWLSSPANTSLNLDNDGIRESLVKRVQSLDTALPGRLKSVASTALMHIEHEVLRRKYISGDTTMFGDLVSDIPRANFYVTEDGYAWDIDELVQSITSNGGIMRNPITKQLFTTNDIRAIVQHPLGNKLAAMEIEQKKLKLGVRPKTIEQLDKLQTILLEDQTADAVPSRRAVDTFMAFLATLPMAEQTSLDKLRVPAIDSHTGARFDTSIGDAVRDASGKFLLPLSQESPTLLFAEHWLTGQGNLICFHKCGDLIKQVRQVFIPQDPITMVQVWTASHPTLRFQKPTNHIHIEDANCCLANKLVGCGSFAEIAK